MKGLSQVDHHCEQMELNVTRTAHLLPIKPPSMDTSLVSYYFLEPTVSLTPLILLSAHLQNLPAFQQR